MKGEINMTNEGFLFAFLAFIVLIVIFAVIAVIGAVSSVVGGAIPTILNNSDEENGGA
jgi:hypothetical protein